MKKFEKIMLYAALLGLVLMLLNFPLSSVILFFSMLLLSCLYFYLGFTLFNNILLRKAFKSESYKGIKSTRIALSVGFGWGLSTLTVGILFYFLNYPLQRSFINVGIISTSIFLALILIISHREFKKQQGIIVRAAGAILIGIILIILPDYYLEKVQYRNHPGYLDAMIKLEADPNNEKLIEEFEEEKLRMILGDEYETLIKKE
jgi:hypothetical protein